MLGPRQKVTIGDLVARAQHYPEIAFGFVRECLSFTAEQVHGPESPVHAQLHEFVFSNGLEWSEFLSRFRAGNVPRAIQWAVEAAGGLENLNRHVSGREICFGLRDFALQRWGILARSVLESWNIRSTADIGRIVFTFIEFDLMQKRPEDTIEEFENVFSFEHAFDRDFRIAIDSVEREPPQTQDVKQVTT